MNRGRAAGWRFAARVLRRFNEAPIHESGKIKNRREYTILILSLQ